MPADPVVAPPAPSQKPLKAKPGESITELFEAFHRETVFLRPMLRAAMRLERAYGGFDKIVDAILAEKVTVIAAVIRESEEQRSGVPDLIESLAGMPLFEGIAAVKEPLIRYVLQLAGNERDGEESDADAERVPFAEHYSRLYRIATGWLGWTPEVAWTSTPAEIIEAYTGRTEMLRAIFGGGEKADVCGRIDGRRLG